MLAKAFAEGARSLGQAPQETKGQAFDGVLGCAQGSLFDVLGRELLRELRHVPRDPGSSLRGLGGE